MGTATIIRKLVMSCSIAVTGFMLLLVIMEASVLPFFNGKPAQESTNLTQVSLYHIPQGKQTQPVTAMQREQSLPEMTLPSGSTLFTGLRSANVHQSAMLAQWLTPFTDTLQAAGAISAEPYLLQEYAAQCEAYMGKVPEFSCTQLDADHNVDYASIVTADQAQSICPRLGGDEECVLDGTVEGRLIPPAEFSETVTILYSCRRYDDATPPGRFDDIAVIQHDADTGNTCWFQSPTVFAFDKQGNVQFDEHGYVLYEDWDGNVVPSPMDYGAQNFWLHPYHPNDLIGHDYLGDMRAGKRGVVAPMNCQRCHDADPFVWTPFVSNTHTIEPGALTIEDWNATGKYVSNFQGIFSADGTHRRQPHVFSPDVVDSNVISTTSIEVNKCSQCHRLGENTITADPTPAPSAYGADVVRLLDIVIADSNAASSNNGIRWMPPPGAAPTTFPELTDSTIAVLRACAADPTGTVTVMITPTNATVGEPIAVNCANGISGNNIENGLPTPSIRPNLQVSVESSPEILMGAKTVEYRIHLRNKPIHPAMAVDTATGIEIVDQLPISVTLLGEPEGCINSTVSKSGSRVTFTCEIADLAAEQEAEITLRGLVSVGIPAAWITNTVEVRTTPTTDNIESIQLEQTHFVQRNADLTLSQIATMEPGGAANPTQTRLKYVTTVRNQGPSTVDNVVVTQILPAGATLDGQLSSVRCTIGNVNNLVRCDLEQLDNGSFSTINIFATVGTVPNPFLAGVATVASPNPDPDPANNQVVTALFDTNTVNQTYLPLIAAERASEADLTVKAIYLTAESADVVIQNIGHSPTLPEETFWVDLYINPDPPPVGVNETIQDRQSDGLVWGVISPTLQLAPGAEYTLRVGDHYFVPNRSSIPREIGAGSVIYVQVDSANLASAFGGVAESHEIRGEPYNNINSVTIVNTIPTANWARAPVTTATNNTPKQFGSAVIQSGRRIR